MGMSVFIILPAADHRIFRMNRSNKIAHGSSPAPMMPGFQHIGGYVDAIIDDIFLCLFLRIPGEHKFFIPMFQQNAYGIIVRLISVILFIRGDNREPCIPQLIEIPYPRFCNLFVLIVQGLDHITVRCRISAVIRHNNRINIIFCNNHIRAAAMIRVRMRDNQIIQRIYALFSHVILDKNAFIIFPCINEHGMSAAFD